MSNNEDDDFKRFCKQEECKANDSLQGLSMKNKSGFSSTMRYSQFLKNNSRDKTKKDPNINNLSFNFTSFQKTITSSVSSNVPSNINNINLNSSNQPSNINNINLNSINQPSNINNIILNNLDSHSHSNNTNFSHSHIHPSNINNISLNNLDSH